MKNILFLGGFYPPHIVDIIKKKSVSYYDFTQISGRSLYYGLKYNVSNDKIYGIVSPQVAAFPKFPEVFIKGKSYLEDNIYSVSSLNIKIIKQLWTIASLIVRCAIVIKKFNNRDKIVIVIPFAMLRFLIVAKTLKLFNSKRVEICVVVPDLPCFLGSGFIERKVANLTTNLLVKSDYIIAFTKEMINELNINSSKAIVMEGFIDTEINSDLNVEDIDGTDEIKIVYTGSLHAKYGIIRLLNAFSKLDNCNVSLNLYGNGDSVSEIQSRSKVDNRIVYHGVKSVEEIREVQKHATILVNPRTSDDGDFTKYSCPSKTLEYLLSGRPSIVGRLAGIPDEYYEYLFTMEDNTEEALYKKMNELINMPKELLLAYGDKGKEFIIKNKSIIVQSKKILDFINK